MIAPRQIRRDAARLWRLSLVGGAPDAARVRRIADLVVASGRRASLDVLETFLRLLKRDDAHRCATVESAAPLDAEMRTAVAAGLARRYGHPMTTTFVVEPSLIGGMRLTAADDVFDDSVKARLAALEMR